MTAPRPQGRLIVGVVVERRALKGPWAAHAWLPHAVLPTAPDAAPWTPIASEDGRQLFYAGAHGIELHPSETGHYRDNLLSGRPSIWVSLRPLADDAHEVAAVTCDPYEGEALAEGVGEIVEAVAMPREVEAEVAAYVAACHVERPFLKRQRDRADSEALARRRRVDSGEGGS